MQSNSDPPKYYDAYGKGVSGSPSLCGKDTSGFSQIFVAKIANESRSAKTIGIVEYLDDNNCSYVKLYGSTENYNNILTPGIDYYLSTNYNINNYNKLITDCYTNCCKNRLIGTACSKSNIIIKTEDVLCDEH
jgi:hypothetical protein